MQAYVALLRGINVGGHHKVPMADLRKLMEQMGFTGISTLLNSGNVIFTGTGKEAELEKQIAGRLEQTFGFPVPVLLRTKEEILQVQQSRPFEGIELTKDIRLYISFLKEEPKQSIPLPWISEDGSCRIIQVEGRSVASILDLSVANTPKAMDELQKLFGKDITTRNWKTISRIAGKL